MKHLNKTLTFATVIILLMTSQAFAKWEVIKEDKSFANPTQYRLHNTKTGQTTHTTYKEEKSAKKAARILNRKDKSVIPLPGGEGDYSG